MKKTKKIIIGITVFLIIIIISIVTFKYKTGRFYNKQTKICCNNTCFQVEIADNDELRQIGLMYREKLDDDKGMLFIYNKPGIHSFWMKNTLIPLASIRLDSNLKIVDIKLMEPCKTEECPSYTSETEVQYILEINQGLIKEKGLLSIGDTCKTDIN